MSGKRRMLWVLLVVVVAVAGLIFADNCWAGGRGGGSGSGGGYHSGGNSYGGHGGQNFNGGHSYNGGQNNYRGNHGINDGCRRHQQPVNWQYQNKPHSYRQETMGGYFREGRGGFNQFIPTRNY